jgi:predicted amidohydrolase YtcJ
MVTTGRCYPREYAVPTNLSPQIFTAGVIHAMTEPRPAAFATVGEWIVAAGPVRELRARFPGAPVRDFGDRVVVPGFNDAHQHPSSMAGQLLDVDLSPEVVSSRAEVLGALRTRAAATATGGWVLGSRYDHTKSTGGVTLTRDELDAACPDHPVFVSQIGMHWGVANSAALLAAGYADDSAAPHGGELGRDDAGRLDGIVYERAMDQLRAVVPPPALADMTGALRRYLTMMHAAGITSVGDLFTDATGLRVLQESHARGELTLRVNMVLGYPLLPMLEQLGLRTGIGDTMLRIGGVKAIADGAVAGGTCLLEEPYENSCGHGIQAMSAAELNDFVRRVHDAGSTACVHANGDRAIRLVLDAVEAAQRASPRPGARHRIEHCTLVDAGILKRIAAQGLVAVPFGSYVAFHGEKLPGYYGMERVSRMFAHRELLDAGIPVAGSSDYPCGPYEVLLAMQSCVTRRAADGTELGPGQRITAAEALALYTTGSAYAAGEEDRKGRLAPGMLADFTVLDADPLTVAPEQLTAIGVRQTWVGANRVWAADGEGD